MKQWWYTVTKMSTPPFYDANFLDFSSRPEIFSGILEKTSFICGSKFEHWPISTYVRRFPDISANIGQISNLAPKMEDNFSRIFEKISEYESEPRKLKILNDRPDIFASYSKKRWSSILNLKKLPSLKNYFFAKFFLRFKNLEFLKILRRNRWTILVFWEYVRIL